MHKSRPNMDSWQFQGSSHTYRSRPFSPGQAAQFAFCDILRRFGTNLGISCKVVTLERTQKGREKGRIIDMKQPFQAAVVASFLQILPSLGFILAILPMSPSVLIERHRVASTFLVFLQEKFAPACSCADKTCVTSQLCIADRRLLRWYGKR